MSEIPAGAKPLGPGVYSTPDGSMHVDLDAYILAAGGNPNSERDRETALRTLHQVMAERGIPVEERE